MSITRIAHDVKCIMRDNIGSTADAEYIRTQLADWIGGYVTTVANPDDMTLRYYPFKKAVVEVAEQEGMIGWYKCSIGVLPHLQLVLRRGSPPVCSQHSSAVPDELIAAVEADDQAASRQAYRWWRPPTRGNPMIMARFEGRNSTARPFGASLMEVWTRSPL